MAESLQFLGNEPTVRAYGTEIVDPGERWTWQAEPSGIVFSLVFAPIPPPQGGASIWTPDAIDQQAHEWADLLAGLLSLPGVTTVTQVQQLDDAQQLHDFVQVTVRSSSGMSVRALQFRQAEVLPPSTVDDVIAQTQAALDQAEAGA